MRINSVLFGLGRGLRQGLIAVGALALVGGAIAFADFTLTQGPGGTLFSSLVIAGKQYVTHLICDATVGQTQCAGVDTNHGLKIVGEGTAGAATGGVVTVQGTSSMTPMQVSQATPANLNGTEVNSSSILAGVIAPEANSAAILAAVSGAIPSGTNIIGYTTSDPCSQLAKSFAPINLTSSAQLITGIALKTTYICSIDLVTATTQNIALVEGTGSVCATNIYGLAGGSTAATGWNLTANASISRGNGAATVYAGTADVNHVGANICLLLSGSGQTSGTIGYVQQ